MTELEAQQFRDAVQHMHGGTATFVQTVPVREEFQGRVVWEGVVHVFDLDGHPPATRAFAWPVSVEGSAQPRYVAVLHTDQIDSPIKAVRAAIVAEHRGRAT